MAKLTPQVATESPYYLARDFRLGRYTQGTISNYLTPQNSVKFCRNVNFDTIVGSAVVRLGTTLLGSAVASTYSPLGLAPYMGKSGSPNYLMSVFKGATTATAYYFDTSWHATNKTALSNTAKDRFAVLSGSLFMTNSTDGMFDAPAGTTFGITNSIGTYKPGLIYQFGARLLASGDPTYPSRVWFSSIVAPQSSPFITWNLDLVTGDWIDIDPDDGGYNTGFAETSTFVLVFKNNGMYRLDTVNKSTDPQNIFNIGAVSQEAIVQCQGIVYFFSGLDIRQTDGSFPQQISRAGVQDIIDAIPQSYWSSVCAGTDGLSVYFSVGTVTLNYKQNDEQILTNCVLKFSPRDQSWSVHTYANAFQFFANWTDTVGTTGQKMRGADTTGQVQTINYGTTDNTTAISYELETQDAEFGSRAHLNKISNDMVVFCKNGEDSSFQAKCDGELKQIKIDLSKRVNIGNDINLEGHWFNFRWFGQTTGTSPVFEGIYIENISDIGITNS